MLNIFLQGFLLQASLILALGAQNIFVMHSGLRKQRHLWVALVSSICDTLLVFVGVLGVATFFVRYPLLKAGLGVVGILKLKEAKAGTNLSRATVRSMTVKQAILTSLGFSLLNPHVYLDAVVLVGGYSSKFSLLVERFYFGAGASVFSTIWFFGLVLLASLAGKLLNSPNAVRVVSSLSGVILILLSLKLGADVLSWIRDVR
jgi:L-lysine exporter family protein LysE/ArgO